MDFFLILQTTSSYRSTGLVFPRWKAWQRAHFFFFSRWKAWQRAHFFFLLSNEVSIERCENMKDKISPQQQKRKNKRNECWPEPKDV
jgi:hypothetical protein